ncbi:glycosyltransferase family 1 protein [Clostridium sp.]|uniref:glycosyltransferase family 1 protein n=1 Tax=Clostridium sp. TaxID=1506 RepID=UPI001DACDB16|nr:glycosyltransferase family 1 protein [Clostridium sp.]MBS5937912.1 glycosyltransferase family 1 protein [Clostridium sp.]
MSEPIRILHVVQRMEAAGIQSFIMNMYRKINREKVQFDFLVHYTTPQFFDEEIEELGGKIYRLSFREDYNIIKYYKELNKFFKEHNEYKVIHGHMHTLGGIYFHVAKKNNIPIRIAHAHTSGIQNNSKKYVKKIMNKFFPKDANILLACSQKAGEYMFGDLCFEVINNAIVLDNFIFSQNIRDKIRKELNLNDKFVIGNVGRMEIEKNQKLSIEIFENIHKKYPNSILLLVGTGSMFDEIKKIVEEKNLENCVLLLGNRKDVSELYQAMDVFLMPSLYEGLGIVCVEAQASGTPVVCTSNLPKELNITPLIYRVSLNDSLEKWVNEIEQAYNNEHKHSDMKEEIIRANYDMVNLAKKMQNFYIEKSKIFNK